MGEAGFVAVGCWPTAAGQAPVNGPAIGPALDSARVPGVSRRFEATRWSVVVAAQEGSTSGVRLDCFTLRGWDPSSVARSQRRASR